MRVLVACEESQVVCKAFRERGHEAYSADIQEPSGGHPEWHILGDVLPLLNGRCSFETMDGKRHEIPDRWDIIIAHPPCTFLSKVATRSFSLRCTPAERVVERWEKRAKAAVFFMYFALADCDKICIENPVGFMSTAFRKPDQYIEPYMFAKSVNDKEQYVTKKTGLWLKGLNPLKTNGLPRPKNAELFGRSPSGKAKTWEEQISRSGKVRSVTFSGIGKAMAEQWG